MENINRKEDDRNTRLIEQFNSYTIAQLKQKLYGEDGIIDPNNPLWINYVAKR